MFLLKKIIDELLFIIITIEHNLFIKCKTSPTKEKVEHSIQCVHKDLWIEEDLFILTTPLNQWVTLVVYTPEDSRAPPEIAEVFKHGGGGALDACQQSYSTSSARLVARFRVPF